MKQSRKRNQNKLNNNHHWQRQLGRVGLGVRGQGIEVSGQGLEVRGQGLGTSDTKR